jgi:hypothetical protein
MIVNEARVDAGHGRGDGGGIQHLRILCESLKYGEVSIVVLIVDVWRNL